MADEDSLIKSGKGVKAGWSGPEEFYKILSGLRQAYLTFNFSLEVEQMFWTLKNELGHVRPYLIKGHEKIEEVEKYIDNAESYIFGQQKGKVLIANKGLAMKELYKAYTLLNQLESINKMWQPTGLTIEQKIKRAY